MKRILLAANPATLLDTFTANNIVIDLTSPLLMEADLRNR